MNSARRVARDPSTATMTHDATNETRSRECPPTARAGSRNARLRIALTSARPSSNAVPPAKNETRPAITLSNAVVPKSVTRTRKAAAKSTATKSHDRPIRGQRQPFVTGHSDPGSRGSKVAHGLLRRSPQRVLDAGQHCRRRQMTDSLRDTESGRARQFCGHGARGVFEAETERPRFRGASKWAVLGSNQ